MWIINDWAKFYINSSWSIAEVVLLYFKLIKLQRVLPNRIFESMDKPIRVEGIDIEIQLVFRKENIELVLPHFQRVGLPEKVLDEMIDAYIKSGETVSYERWFLEYGQRIINPLMNQKLGRAQDHPTFNNLLRHALKDILKVDPILKQFRNFQQSE